MSPEPRIEQDSEVITYSHLKRVKGELAISERIVIKKKPKYSNSPRELIFFLTKERFLWDQFSFKWKKINEASSSSNGFWSATYEEAIAEWFKKYSKSFIPNKQ